MSEAGSIATAADSNLRLNVFGHRLQLVLGPSRDGMNVAIFIAHEFECAQRNGDRLGADTKEATDIDHGLSARACAVHMRDRTDLVITRTAESAFSQRLTAPAPLSHSDCNL